MVRVHTVDDQDAFRDVARAIVGMTGGFEVVAESRDGETAVESAREVDADVVIVDEHMTGIDGIETARRMSATDAPPVIVLVSGSDLAPLMEPARACGVAAILQKQWLTPALLRGLWIAHRRR